MTSLLSSPEAPVPAPIPVPAPVPVLDLDAYRSWVEADIGRFLDAKARGVGIERLPAPAVESLRTFFRAGGKRLRPLLCACGWLAARGGRETAGLIRVGAALEMFHAFALIHDDVMDRSDLRRGRPTVHRLLAADFARSHPTGDSSRLGESAAILVGDLSLAWSDELIHSAGLEPAVFARVLGLIDRMRSELMFGQYLDLVTDARSGGGCAQPLTVIRYKTAKYTVERPLQIGAVLAGAGEDVLADLSAIALPLGEAFQLRDDLLGTFGDPGVTGKSRLDDLRAGKHTVLIALALGVADRDQTAVLHGVLGNEAISEADADRARHVLDATGATARVERMIADRYRRTLAALDRAALPADANEALRSLAHDAVWRRV